MKLSGFNDNRGKSGMNNPSGGDAVVTLTKGILDCRRLPDDDFMALWDAIVLNGAVKDRLLSQAVLNFTLRPRIHRSDLPLHGIILLVGEPGTGKTSLARGLAARTAEILKTLGKFLYLEVEPHALASAALGKSQKAVTELLGSTIAEYAAGQPLIVLLDEVETLAANRSKMSMEANPIDVHRATDAVLAQLDQLAAKYSQLLFLATSNFPAAIDNAFLSRADLAMTIEPPGPEQSLLSHYKFKPVKGFDSHETYAQRGACEGPSESRASHIGEPTESLFSLQENDALAALIDTSLIRRHKINPRSTWLLSAGLTSGYSSSGETTGTKDRRPKAPTVRC